MTFNVGKKERILRVLIGVLALTCILRLGLATWANWALGAIAVISIVTGLVRFCPLNQLFKIKPSS